MFESIGWAEILVLGIAGLFILGPERLPSAAAWVGRSMRKVREFATGARDQLKGELGTDFDDLRKPLQDLQQLRNFDPKQMVAKQLFGDDSNGVKPNGYASSQPAIPPVPPAAAPKPEPPRAPGERPPIDPDAT
ncbi:Sec-independent protein translocase protein TatB [Actinokineospora globicatena]|uniref:Sec-independent protein translocase protein TatB n=1 Tax=Actinokineospora globicatena TaxID=103729 RepID=UPI0020A3FF3F|nr:Sec-independent protein translocase protein TatB [Actinokineospora globicatena]MCP2300446.1 sec-independent protein translocase protein TatB [Actinokineospora globicatena]GLW80980.1 sec-independent protein translocase protein TatB [Actinokineospora globicatena]GLW88173.1 sec-independent protein translocase protein TatB [Actinokineospora globicatena]